MLIAAGVAATAAAAAIVLGLYGAYVGVKLYNWFILPVFPTLPVLGYWQMFGIQLAALTLFSNSEKIDDAGEYITENVYRLTIALIIGYGLHLFM